MKNHISILSKGIICSIVLILGCIEPYPPPESTMSINYLVVDGFVNVTEGTANIRLTRAVSLADEAVAPPPELNAQVIVADNVGNQFSIPQTGNGNYASSGLLLDHSRQYTLRIITSSGKEYESNPVSPKTTPPIDSVTWRATETGIQVLVNTHDDSGNSRYYQWSYEETWEYTSALQSSFRFLNDADDAIVLRNPDENIYYCWKSQPSTQILVYSSYRLASDIVSNIPINTIPAGSQKVSRKYSILVRQNTLTREAYDFWKQLEQTTENLGGLFDPQPGAVLGNIHAINSNETVLGFFNVGDVTSQRIFIKFSELPNYLQYYYPPGGCYADSIEIENISNLDRGSYNLLGSIYQGPFLIGYTFTTKPCSDCRYSGGSIEKPDFWE